MYYFALMTLCFCFVICYILILRLGYAYGFINSYIHYGVYLLKYSQYIFPIVYLIHKVYKIFRCA